MHEVVQCAWAAGSGNNYVAVLEGDLGDTATEAGGCACDCRKDEERPSEHAWKWGVRTEPNPGGEIRHCLLETSLLGGGWGVIVPSGSLTGLGRCAGSTDLYVVS